MSHQLRSTVLVALAGLLLVTLAGIGSACVGARALAMGGAFTGLADDASATYWNPAALPDLKDKELTYMHVFNEDINYQDYFAYAAPLNDRSAIGLSYIKSNLMSLSMYDSSLSWGQSWYWLSYGTRVGEKTAVGANIRFISNDVAEVFQGAPVDISADTDVGFDLALYHHASETVTLGLLVQDVNRPETDVTEAGVEFPEFRKMIRNYRPGVAVRVPDQSIIVSAEVYDALDSGDARALRVGIEKKFPEKRFALRAGRYAAGEASGLTLGAGVWKETWAFDVAFLGGDLDNTWVASATAKF